MITSNANFLGNQEAIYAFWIEKEKQKRGKAKQSQWANLFPLDQKIGVPIVLFFFFVWRSLQNN